MDGLEGYLLIPPERTQFLSKTAWKARYVVIGQRSLLKEHPSQQSYSQLVTTGRSNSSTPKPPVRTATGDFSISLYRTKFDLEPSQQWPLALATQCEIKNVAPKKHDTVQPTLVVTFSDKERKRRSSRAASMISLSKESSNVVLYLRTTTCNEHSLEEWARAISLKMIANSISSPSSSGFVSPFSPRLREHSEYFTRRTSEDEVSPFDYRQLQHKSSTTTYSTATTRDRPLTFSSESPSLRSKRSDISSPSSAHAPHGIVQHYTTVLPSDLPSPITSVPEHEQSTVEGWVKAQGRGSTMGPPGSAQGPGKENNVATTATTTMSGRRETILDRAFQLRCIPGSEREVPGEEKLSSLARFDALMREAEEKRKIREMSEQADLTIPRSAFDADDTSDEERPGSVDSDLSDSDFEEDPEAYVHDHSSHLRQPSAGVFTHRALQALTMSEENVARSASLPRSSLLRATLNYQAPDSTSADAPRRPSTSHSRPRPLAQRTSSTSQIPYINPVSPITARIPDDVVQHASGDKHLSVSSIPSKRLSFTEFTKRLSSTSSLLLAQTDGADGDVHGLHSRSSGSQKRCSPSRPSRDDVDLRCAWRPAIEAQGGFL